MARRDTRPFVSVVLPTFNRAGLLPRAIESVLRQTYGDFELGDHSLRATLGARGRAFAQARYEWSVIRPRLDDAYCRLGVEAVSRRVVVPPVVPAGA